MNTVQRIILLISFLPPIVPGGAWANNDGSNYIRTTTFLTTAGDTARSRVATVYYDGMGREILNITGVPGNMTAFLSDYDLRGNLWRKWLPVPGDVSCLNKQIYKSKADDFYGIGETAYTEYGYEETGRNRQVSVTGPGNHWSGKDVTTSFHRNVETGAADYDQKYICSMLLVNDDGSVTVSGAYKSATLRITETADEDGLRVLEYSTRAGKTVLKRVIGTDGLTADTRFVYDIRGDLRYVISPEGSRDLPASGTVDQDILDSYAQCYVYDFRHRCVSAKVPGCGATEYVYDKYGHIIFSADAEQRARSEWTVTKYDIKMRPAVQGLSTLPGQTRQTLQTTYGDTTLIESFAPDYNKMEYSLQYTNTSGPSDFTPYMAWFYDNYDFIQNPNHAFKTLFETPSDGTYTAIGLNTGTAMVNASGETVYRAFKYDSRKNITMTCQWDCYLQQYRYTETTDYDFVGQPVARTETKETMTEGTVLTQDVIRWQYTYDSMGRLTEQTLSLNDATPFTVTTAQYDAIGRLLSEWRGTDVTYDYDIRGHVAGISSDVYSETAGYGDNPFNPQTTSYKFLNYTTERWGGAKPYAISMSYTYDGLGRMKSAVSQGGEDGPELSETVDVDLDANVVGVMRKYKRALVQDAVLTMDGGKAIVVNDASSPYYADRVGRFPDGSYSMSYDRNGRLIADGTRQIKAVTYHKYIDRPNRITMDNGDYTVSQYLPDGTLTRRTFCSKRIETVTKVNADGDTIVRNVTRTSSNIHDYMGSFWTVRGETKARRVVTSAGYVDLTTGKRYWYVTNRQGSTMAVVDETGTVVQRNGYYPSGTPYVLPSETDAPSLTAVTDRLHIGNRWLSHSGLNWYDNTARMHDPLLMRFATPDPLWQEYPGISSWSHCAANPVNFVDQTGERPSASEAANMANFVYDYNGELSGNWEYYDSSDFNIDDKSTGFKCAIFKRKLNNGRTEYAMAFAGTDKNSFVDYIENIGQIFGETKQYSQAVKIAAKVNESLNKDNDKNMMTFIGHSLGGGQAAAASLKTGMPAITFNPAALSMKTKENLSITGQKGDVTNYVTIGKIIMSSEKLSIYIGGDPLYNAQSKTNLRLEGKTIFVKTNSMSLSHGIEDISKFL